MNTYETPWFALSKINVQDVLTVSEGTNDFNAGESTDSEVNE